MELYDRPVEPARRRLRRRPADRPAAGPACACRRGLAGFRVGARTLPLWRAGPRAAGGVRRAGRSSSGSAAEDVSPATAGATRTRWRSTAWSSDVEYTGQRNVVTVAVDALRRRPRRDAKLVRRERDAARPFPPRAVVRPGDAVRVAVDAARAHVFDAVTGGRSGTPTGRADSAPMSAVGRSTGPESSWSRRSRSHARTASRRRPGRSPRAGGRPGGWSRRRPPGGRRSRPAGATGKSDAAAQSRGPTGGCRSPCRVDATRVVRRRAPGSTGHRGAATDVTDRGRGPSLRTPTK